MTMHINIYVSVGACLCIHLLPWQTVGKLQLRIHSSRNIKENVCLVPAPPHTHAHPVKRFSGSSCGWDTFNHVCSCGQQVFPSISGKVQRELKRLKYSSVQCALTAGSQRWGSVLLYSGVFADSTVLGNRNTIVSVMHIEVYQAGVNFKMIRWCAGPLVKYESAQQTPQCNQQQRKNTRWNQRSKWGKKRYTFWMQPV